MKESYKQLADTPIQPQEDWEKEFLEILAETIKKPSIQDELERAIVGKDLISFVSKLLALKDAVIDKVIEDRHIKD